jgi:hypothetical protein
MRRIIVKFVQEIEIRRDHGAIRRADRGMICPGPICRPTTIDG